MTDTNEQSPLLDNYHGSQREPLAFHLNRTDSALERLLSENEQKLAEAYVGERLPYSEYSSIDFLHDLVRFLYL